MEPNAKLDGAIAAEQQAVQLLTMQIPLVTGRVAIVAIPEDLTLDEMASYLGQLPQILLGYLQARHLRQQATAKVVSTKGERLI